MKKVIYSNAVYVVLCFCCITATAQNNRAVLTDRSKAGIMAYLKKLIRTDKVMIGQQCSETPDIAFNYKKAFQSIFDSTGKYPALLGLDYGYFDKLDRTLTNRYAIDHWKRGGLVTISWHADNPFKEGYDVRWDAAKNRDSIVVKRLLKNAPASIVKVAYRRELTAVATALRRLQNAGVVVLWRPFHEVNGTWFWWGVNHSSAPTNTADYLVLWQDMYETFTNDFQLKNLLWVYSPFTPGQSLPAIGVMYPGDKYVDIVAVDSYPRSPDFKDYEALQKFGKLVANGEIGPSKEGFGKFDEMEVLRIFKGKAAYFLQWHSWTNAKVAIADNINFKQMMNDPAAITLDKIKR